VGLSELMSSIEAARDRDAAEPLELALALTDEHAMSALELDETMVP
jgi:hypothetical protein